MFSKPDFIKLIFKNRLLFLVYFAGAMNLPALAENKSAPVVVELFTSQGCSSCPRADKFLGELSEDPSIITLSCHVTYWNYLGWEDSFSLKYCDSRQAFYRDLFNNRSSYTPQMVINGKYEGVGSQQQKINQLIQGARKHTKPVEIKMTLNGTRVSVDIGNLDAHTKKRFDLLGLGVRQTVDIKRGENEGRSINYTHPVLAHYELTELAKTDSNKTSIDIASSNRVSNWVVLANDLQTGAIIGVGAIHTTSVVDN